MDKKKYKVTFSLRRGYENYDIEASNTGEAYNKAFRRYWDEYEKCIYKREESSHPSFIIYEIKK